MINEDDNNDHDNHNRNDHYYFCYELHITNPSQLCTVFTEYQIYYFYIYCHSVDTLHFCELSKNTFSELNASN